MSPNSLDAVVVGAGPNGLAAGITLARAGRSVLVVEAEPTVGGGTRTAELTLPGFRHDVCSAIHPLGAASPFFRTVPLEEHGVKWIQPQAALAHPLDDGSATVLERSVDRTAERLGADGRAYARLMKPLVESAEVLLEELLGPFRPPRHPFVMARFGMSGARSALALSRRFKGDAARALLAGVSAHSMLPLSKMITGGFGLMLGLLGHAVGWPMPEGGSQAIADALSAYLRTIGGEIETSRRIGSIADLPSARAILFDLTPRQVLRIVGDRFPDGYARRLSRYRYGPGVFKIDWALSDPVPWRADGCRTAGTVHLGGTIDEIRASEDQVWQENPPERPFVILAQQSLFDPSRAPDGQHTAWGYCHVPHGSSFDMTERIESQIERFAPGFKDVILARSVMDPSAMERYNANYIGGDINGGVQDLRQHFTRPVARISPYTTPDGGIFLCSSSTPPGGGVHGMCGYWAAKAVLRRM